ncbi:hypothetical protein C0993_012693, partial [Termitomyces sp. T159_Od127]
MDKISQTRPARRTLPTAKLTDENNVEQPTLPFQRKAVDAFHEQQAQDRENEVCKVSNATMATDEKQDSQKPVDQKDSASKSGTSGQKRVIVIDSDNEPESEVPLKKLRISLGNPTAVGNDGFLADINIQPIEEEKEKREDKRRDVNHFFHEPSVRQLNGKEKSCCVCKICPGKKPIVNEATTLRRHLEAYHSGKYQKWAQENNFESKLPGDVKKRKADAEHA